MERAVPVLPASDLRAAKAFYCEASSDGITGVLGVERGTLALTLDCPMDGHGREACAALEVGSADAYYAEWKDRVAIQRPPRDEPWGARTFDLLDPFGNTLFVISTP
ncbi:MAG TPA: VOC family protein [Candidatus Polarisedimenticolia bacterium]|nr:VOC family protein [Candidatus Polarisedimenticolia bacterium]